MSQGWIIIVSDGDEARRFVVAELLLDQAKSLVAQRYRAPNLFGHNRFRRGCLLSWKMTRGDVIEWGLGACVLHPKRSTLSDYSSANMRELGVHHLIGY